MRVAYLDCFSGAAGDMIVGSLIGAGCEPEYLQTQIDKLNLPDVRLVANTVFKQGLSGIAVRFDSDDKEPAHRHLSDIEKILRESSLDDEIKKSAMAIFRRIGEAEARIHDVAIEKVHFHEVGALDAICDIVSAAAGMKRLGIEKLYSSAILVGRGLTESAHGIIPLPAPATLEIAKGFPVRQLESIHELTTPTGAAIIRELADYLENYEMIVERVGYGAGTAEFSDRPNMLRLLVGKALDRDEHDRVVIIETNLDDATPEEIGYLQGLLFDCGALDVFVTSILMKKNRPGHLLSAICGEEKGEELALLLLRESTAAGVRMRRESRRKLAREIHSVETKFGKIRIKFFSGGDIRKFAPEYDDVARAAKESGATFDDVYQAAILAAGRFKGEQT